MHGPHHDGMHQWYDRCPHAAAAALLLCQVSTTYRGQATSDVIPHHIALDPAVPGRLYASDSRASAIYVWDGPGTGTTLESACIDSGLQLGMMTVRKRRLVFRSLRVHVHTVMGPLHRVKGRQTEQAKSRGVLCKTLPSWRGVYPRWPQVCAAAVL